MHVCWQGAKTCQHIHYTQLAAIVRLGVSRQRFGAALRALRSRDQRRPLNRQVAAREQRALRTFLGVPPLITIYCRSGDGTPLNRAVPICRRRTIKERRGARSLHNALRQNPQKKQSPKALLLFMRLRE